MTEAAVEAVEVRPCVLCGQPGTNCIYLPAPRLIGYALCRECNDGPDCSLRIEAKLDPERYITADREAGETLAAARSINTERLEQIRDLHDRIGRMLRASGEPGRCRDCGAAITWLRNHNGRALPYDADGRSHLKVCPRRPEIAIGVLLHEAT